MRTSRGRRLLGGALLGVLLLGITGAAVALPIVAATPAQQGPGLILVNADQGFIQRDSDGGFTARPILSAQPEMLAYGVKDPMDGSWLTALYIVRSSPRSVSGGWEYTINYPTFAEQPDLDPDRAYVLALYAQHGEMYIFEATIPFHEPTGLWDRVINAFNPANWMRSIAGWIVEGIHGLMCSVLGRITGGGLDHC